MNREQLEEIRARAEAATPGPWAMYDANEGSPESGPLWSVANDAYHNPPADEGAPWIGADVRVGDKADAEFVAHARTDVPALLDEIDRRPPIEMEELKQLFDLIANSMDFGSGFLDGEDTVLLRRIAVVIGVDPMAATPSTEVSNYPHEFKLASYGRCHWCNQERANHLHPAATTAEGSAEGGTSKGSEAVAKPYGCPGCGARYRTAEHAAGCADDHVPAEGRCTPVSRLPQIDIHNDGDVVYSLERRRMVAWMWRVGTLWYIAGPGRAPWHTPSQKEAMRALLDIATQSPEVTP